MSNKRTLKKNVRRVCGALAAETLLARHIAEGIDTNAVTKIITDIADLQCTTLANATFSFDKQARDFDTRAAYHKARTAYHKKAYTQLWHDFTEGVNTIVKAMNAAVPAEARKQAMEL